MEENTKKFGRVVMIACLFNKRLKENRPLIKLITYINSYGLKVRIGSVHSGKVGSVFDMTNK